MHDFQWVASAFLLQHLRLELLVSLTVLLAVLLATAVMVAVELRKRREDDHADQ